MCLMVKGSSCNYTSEVAISPIWNTGVYNGPGITRQAGAKRTATVARTCRCYTAPSMAATTPL